MRCRYWILGKSCNSKQDRFSKFKRHLKAMEKVSRETNLNDLGVTSDVTGQAKFKMFICWIGLARKTTMLHANKVNELVYRDVHKNWHICFTIFTELNVARMNLRIPNDSAIHGNLLSRHLSYTYHSHFSTAAGHIRHGVLFSETQICSPPEDLYCFLHVLTDPARAAAPTDLLICVRIL